MNEILANKVPELMAVSVILAGVLGTMWKLVSKMTTAVETQSIRHESAQEKIHLLTFDLVKETNKFHADLSNKTHDVIVRNTIQNAQCQVVLDKVLEKLK